MGRKKPTSQIYASAHSFDSPQGLDRVPAVDQQALNTEDTIIWGDDDALPLRQLQAVNQSPTATSCLGKVADYIQGSGFTDPGIKDHVIDQDGTTLGALHNQLADYMAKLEGFSTRFTFDRTGSITNCFLMPMESERFVRPKHEKSKKITQIKYNPYWGTPLYKQDLTKCYNVWEGDTKKRYQEVQQADENYLGQIYFEGTPRAPYKFYPVAKYWSGANAIYVDAAIDSFVKTGLDNGFFQSVLINMIGDPTQPSQNPKYQKKVTGTDGTVRTEWDGVTTVGMEFEAMMSQSFSGHDKAFKAMVMWALNQEASAKISPFPESQSFALVDTLEIRTIRKITIATEVPAILANLPQQVSSLGSDGNSMRAAVELMHARVREPQQVLEAFYNNVLLPNLQNKTQARVKIINHTPLSNQVQVPDKVWEWMNDEEKAEFVRNNVPSVKVIRTATVAQPVTPGATPAPAEPGTEAKVNEALKGLNLRDITKFTKIAQRLAKGDISRDQAKQILMGYGLDEEQIKAWLPDEEAVVV